MDKSIIIIVFVIGYWIGRIISLLEMKSIINESIRIATIKIRKEMKEEKKDEK